MRGPSPVTASISTSLPSAQIGKSDSTFQSVLAIASEERSSSTGGGQSVLAAEKTTDRNAGSQPEAQSSPVPSISTQSTLQSMPTQTLSVASIPTHNELSSDTSERVVASDHEKTSAKGASKATENDSAQNSAASDTSAVSAAPLDVHVPVVVTPDAQVQPLASQSMEDTSATELTAMPLKQLNVPTSFAVITDEVAGAPIASNGTQSLDEAIQAGAETVQVSLETPLGAVLPANAGVSPDSAAVGTQSLGKATQKATSDTTTSKNPLQVSAANAGTNKSAVPAIGLSNASSHSGQNSGQSSQDSQASPTASAAAMPRTVDNVASQIQAQVQTVVASPVAHEVAPPLRTAGNLADVPRTADLHEATGSMQLDGGEAAATSAINSAKIIQAMSGTEMRVGMHSTDFGDISIRTSVSQQQMLTQISLDHSELSQTLSAHISAVQAKLGDEYGLHALIEINNQGSSLAGDSDHPSHKQQETSTSLRQTASVADPQETDKGTNIGMLVAAGNEHRLDLRA